MQLLEREREREREREMQNFKMRDTRARVRAKKTTEGEKEKESFLEELTERECVCLERERDIPTQVVYRLYVHGNRYEREPYTQYLKWRDRENEVDFVCACGK